jgi:hypothetical protein
VALLAPAARAGLPQPVDPQLRDRAILGEINAPMAVRFSPAGQVVVAQKSGLVRRFSGIEGSAGVSRAAPHRGSASAGRRTTSEEFR